MNKSKTSISSSYKNDFNIVIFRNEFFTWIVKFGTTGSIMFYFLVTYFKIFIHLYDVSR